MPTILIAGGYGAVGRKIATVLAAKAGNTVIIAGRSLSRAKAAALTLQAEARAIDLAVPASWASGLEGVDLVIACIDQTDTAFLAEVSRRGIAYLDVTAGDDFFRKAEAMVLTTPVLLSVGLAPGLSNLLSVVAAVEMDTVRNIEIGLLMGTGDEHGAAAIAWSTRNMFDPEAPRDDAMVDFGPDFGLRKAHYMNFADQHVLARTNPGTATITRVTYDSALLSRLLFWLGRRFAGNRTMEKLVERASHVSAFGSDKCVLSVTATGMRDGHPVAQTAHFFGRREAAVTAAVAALMAEELLAGRVPSGVHHSHQAIQPSAIFSQLQRLGHGSMQLGPLRPDPGS